MKKFTLAFLVISFTTSINAQKVGIGTTTPLYRLHVVDSTTHARAIIQAPVGGDYAELLVFAGTNDLNSLSLRKHFLGTPGTLAGIPKDNLSVLGTEGNGGALLLNTGDGSSPIIIAPGLGESTRFLSNGQVSIGTSTPASIGKLHVHEGLGQDVSIVLTNSLTGPGLVRGGRFRLVDRDLDIMNYEATGKVMISTNFNTRLTVDAVGNVGIGVFSPNHKLDIASSGTGIGINVEQSGSVPAIKATTVTGSSQIGLELNNGAIKVSGANRTVFQITANTGAGGNTSGNTLTIPNTTLANAATDLLIVTPVYVTVYLNKPIGVWWDGANWNIFTQDLTNMPNGARFNVMVVKQ